MLPAPSTPASLSSKLQKLGRDVVRNRRIIFLTAVVNSGSLLFGYDSGIAGAVIVLPSFQRDFGIHGSPEARAHLNSSIVSVLFGGAFLGALIATPSSYYLGRRVALLIGSFFFLSGGAIQTACFGNVKQMYAGRFLAGVGVGTVSQVCPVYVGECASKTHRSRAVSAFQLNLVTGGMLAYWAGYGVSVNIDPGSSTQWRIPIGLQLLPGVIATLGLFFIPESPRFLARMQAEEERKQRNKARETERQTSPTHKTNTGLQMETPSTTMDILESQGVAISQQPRTAHDRTTSDPIDTFTPPFKKRLPWFHYFHQHDSLDYPSPALATLAYLRHEPPTSPAVQAELAEIFAQIHEAQEEAGLGKSKWKELFLKPSNRRRLGVAIFTATYKIWVAQTAVLYYAPTIFKTIGFSDNSTSLLASGVFTLLKVVATMTAMILTVNRYGRVTGLTVGGLIQGSLFYAVGAILATHPVRTEGPSVPSAASKGMLALLYTYVVVYSFALGPLPWVLASEIFPIHLRDAGQLVFSLVTWGNNFAIAKVTPIGFVELGWKMWMLFGSFNVGGAIICWFICPETRGRSIEAIDIIFGDITEEERAENVENALRQRTIASSAPAPQSQ